MEKNFMYIQGNLQAVFDALFEMGMIEPVLSMDWSQALEEMHNDKFRLSKIVRVVNEYQTDVNGLVRKLKTFDKKSLSYLAMEVAREFADYHSRDHVH